MNNFQEKISNIYGNIELGKIIKSGPVSKIYSCNFNNINSIIRIDLPIASELALDRKRELLILNHISAHNISPKILYSDVDNGILIWKYIPGDELQISKNNDLIIQQLGRTLKKLHKIKIPKNSKNNFNDSIIFYKKLLANSCEEKFLKKGFELYEEIYEKDLPTVLSHNDLNKTNLLLSKKIYFLDWEYVSFNSPYYDIASIVASFNLNDHGVTTLLKEYSDDLYKICPKKLNKWVNFTYYLDYIWRKVIVKKENSYNKAMKLHEIEHILQNL